MPSRASDNLEGQVDVWDGPNDGTALVEQGEEPQADDMGHQAGDSRGNDRSPAGKKKKARKERIDDTTESSE